MLSTDGLVLSKRKRSTHQPPRNTTCQFWLGWSSSSFHVFICWWNACHAYVPERFAVCMLKTCGSGHVKLQHHSASWSVNVHWNAFANFKNAPKFGRRLKKDQFLFVVTTAFYACLYHTFSLSCVNRFSNTVVDETSVKQSHFHKCFTIGLYVRQIQKYSHWRICFPLKSVGIHIQSQGFQENLPSSI